MSAISVSK